jgi:hypothetical protein
MNIPNPFYAKIVSRRSGEVFAYFTRSNEYIFSDTMSLWFSAVFSTYTIDRLEFETDALAFELAPVIGIGDIAVIALCSSYVPGTYRDIEDGYLWKEQHGGPWYMEPTLRTIKAA